MQFMLTFMETQDAFAHRNDPQGSNGYWSAWMEYIKALRGSGVVVSGAGLQPPHTATTVRLRDGRREVQDGPFADSKEQLGGFFVLDVPDLDAALDWAAKAPCATGGAVEVRPVMPRMPYGS